MLTRARETDTFGSRHVFHDLLAYSCTFEDCDHGPFGSRSAWATHEHRHHLRSWSCPICHNDFDTEDHVTRHVATHHPSIDQGMIKEVVYAASPKLERVPLSRCAFCDDRQSWKGVQEQPFPLYSQAKHQDDRNDRDVLVSVPLYHRHISHHMEQLALFAVPPIADCNEDGDASDHSSNVATDQSATDHMLDAALEAFTEDLTRSSEDGVNTNRGTSGVKVELQEEPELGLPTVKSARLGWEQSHIVKVRTIVPD